MRLFSIIFLLTVKLGFAQDTLTFPKEIPQNSRYSTIRKFEGIFNLDTIENGFDSLQIRIWYFYPKYRTPKNVFILKRQSNKWTSLWYNLDKDTLQVINPKSNINIVVDQLLSSDIMTLPNMQDINGFEDGFVDGDSYIIEVSDNKHYRLYGYHMPEEFQMDFIEAKKVVNILKLIRQEFDIPLAHRD